MSPNLTFVLVVLSLCSSTSATHIITKTVHVPHQLFDLDDNSTRIVTVPFTLYARTPVRSRPLIIILPGGLILASDYELLSSALAHRGFIVAIPQYDERPPPATLTHPEILAHLNLTSTLEPPCPTNGQFPSAALISSFLTYVSQRAHSHWLLRKILVDRTVVFGHSIGGSAAFFFVSGQCATFNPLDLSPFSFLCEQVAPLPLPARIVGLALYEGLPIFTAFKFPIPSDLFISVLDSPFDVTNTKDILQPNGNLVEALISEANHHGPNDFTNATMIPRCALPQAPEAMFRTDYRTQRTVISTIATIVSRSYLVFFKGQDKKILTNMPGAYPRVETLTIT